MYANKNRIMVTTLPYTKVLSSQRRKIFKRSGGKWYKRSEEVISTWVLSGWGLPNRCWNEVVVR